MLPQIHRLSSILRNSTNNSLEVNKKSSQLVERLSNKSSSSSGKSTEDGNNVYIETLLYIVHVDDIDLPEASNEQIKETEDNINDATTKRMSKRTTASFNERHKASKIPIYARPSLNFTNSLRRINSLIKTSDKETQSPSTSKLNEPTLYSPTLKKSSTLNNNNNNNADDDEQQFPPPPPSFLCDNLTANTDDKPSIKAKGPGLKDGYVDDNCYFDLIAPNAELQKLVIAIDGPSKADIQIEVVDTDTYRVFYLCQTPGVYHISVTYDGENINDSPFNLRLLSRSSQEQVVPPVLSPPINSLRAIIEPTEFHANTACIVTVRPRVPCTVFQAYIQAPQMNVNLPITVHKSAKSEHYEIYFVPIISGIYWLNVSLNHVPIVDNPYRLVVRPTSSTKSIAATGQGLFHAYTGEISQFFVSKSPNDLSKTSGNFSVGISGPSTVFLDANETEHGYEFQYKPMRSGKYIITIKNGGKHIQGSPFLCRVYNKLNESCTMLSTMYETENDSTTQVTTSSNSLLPVKITKTSTTHVDLDILRSSMTGDASQVCAFGTGLYEAKLKRKTTFKIDASQAGPGILLVGLYSSFGPCERLVVKRVMPSSPGYIYKVSYRAQKRGQYMLTILYGSAMQHVPGSPFLVIVE